MKDIIEYNGFLGSVHFDADDEVFFGRIEGIEDLVSFEGKSVKQLKKAFQESVDDYLVLCQKAKKSPERSFKGSFNVRIPTELHRRVYRKSLREGISLNQLVQRALEKEITDLKTPHFS
ncbi:type II toxin-antitoxin system HicB family antitoxin [Leptospira gomenensis]|uniref:Type II toxin-antitoxin system HicB family antitoxin n=1 Tax=Leptospira gomenensis TaxID=2484974 RepID=A0A5F1Y847_9LEPT|nr:type II toxin-antitoxin system HicB family antitoxin [Leptospira gomenensis]TGK31118.1 type II toxin-antitoxin system HicB family antitoxin [Leptospira gomenensis]TGK43322.1 type II toxin-antitoxin system HicB family antitoxin [Leptospira gomenensis]TGK45163.1 type II toxin-antitoxin system HicB family antitoxin [Leptospira gomenensis]TGK66077.1 type II toxin-antitoxin system HicB family antitoxin [Leptospira gomenensis]